MGKVLRQEWLETDLSRKEWLHWKRTFENFMSVLPQEGLDKLAVLANFVLPSIFQHIEECSEFLLTTLQNPGSLSKSTATINIGEVQVKVLFDSGSTLTFIHPSLVQRAGLAVQPASGAVTMASTALSVNVTVTCTTGLEYQAQKYANLHLLVLSVFCADLILGLDFQSQHKSITFQYRATMPLLSVCGFSTLSMDPAAPFANLNRDCHPIASKLCHYSTNDLRFIEGEVERLLKEGIIEPSNSPWRTQVVVTKDENHKKAGYQLFPNY